jgi:hypothetical protein
MAARKGSKQANLDDKKLLKLGKERGFVTQEEILQVFPTPEETLEELDSLPEAYRSRSRCF